MFYRRNSLRLKNFNYTKPCVYFITMCVNQHLCLFGEVNDRKLKLNAAGKMIAKVFTNLRKYYKGTVLDTYIVMPNHFHGIIIIDHTVGASLCGRPSKNILGNELNQQKNDCTKTKILMGQTHSKGRGYTDPENCVQTPNDRTLFFNNFFATNKFNDIYFGRHNWGRAWSTKMGQAWSTKMGRARRPAPTHDQLSLGEIIGRFKSYTTTQYISGVKNNKWKPFYEKLWQRGYYDHIVKDKKELFAIRKYIVDNPLHWEK